MYPSLYLPRAKSSRAKSPRAKSPHPIRFCLLIIGILEISTSCAQTDSELLQCPTNSPQSELNSFLWTLKRDPPSYFFGTIHVAYTRVWDYIPQSAKNAFRYSDQVYFELDITDAVTVATLANCQLLPEGQTMSDVVPRRLYRRLTRHMQYVQKQISEWIGEKQKSRGIKDAFYSDYQYRAIVGSWQRMKPVWLMLLLNSLTKNSVQLFTVPVLDLYLSRQAVQWRKKIGAIEEVTEQCEPLNSLNHTTVIFALNQTLKQLENHRKNSQSMPENDDLITQYNCGDLQSALLKKTTMPVDLTALGQETQPDMARMARQVDNYFQQQLLYKRNEIMADRIEQLFNDNPNQSFFFALGAGHFLGNNSVIDRLVSKGFPIKHTRPESFIQSHSQRDSSKRYTFSHMDSSLLVSEPYMEAIRKLDQVGTSGSRPIRHERNRRKYRKEKPYNIKNTQEDEPNFSKLWIRVEEIRQVTEAKSNYLYQETESIPTPISAALHRESSHLISCIVTITISRYIFNVILDIS